MHEIWNSAYVKTLSQLNTANADKYGSHAENAMMLLRLKHGSKRSIHLDWPSPGVALGELGGPILYVIIHRIRAEIKCAQRAKT